MTKGLTRTCAVACALAALAGPGCYIVAGPPVPAVPPRAAAPQASIGFGPSVGLFTTMDSELPYGLSEGFMWNMQASIWLSEMMALQFEYGAAVLDDSESPLGGDMTIAPATVSVIFSVPDPYAGGNVYRWRFGVGGGVANLDHSKYEVDSIGIFRLQAGGEWVLLEGGRLFAVADVMIGQKVWDASDSWFWDLTSMSSLRVGLEFGF